jgi:hypothetical protein
MIARFSGMKRVRKSEASRPSLLGRVTAPDEAGAEAAAATEFGLKDYAFK